MSALSPVLVAGSWRESRHTGSFQAVNPSTGDVLPQVFPVSSREEALEAVAAAAKSAPLLRDTEGRTISAFLEDFAAGIERRKSDLVEMAHQETGLAKTPRLADGELPRTTDQLRQAARAAREDSWRRPIRDDARRIYSTFAPLGGPVIVFGPNNFPFAFNSVAGGDFVAALAAHNPVIAKANTGHPGTTRLLAEIAFEALKRTGLPDSSVQLLYRTPAEVGLELVSHPLTGASAFTGSRAAGMKLKRAADEAGKPIYLELSSVNPVIILEGALRERTEAIASEFFSSCTAGTGQFCTNPGIVVLPDTKSGREFVDAALRNFRSGSPGVLLNSGVGDYLLQAVSVLKQNGAELLCGGNPGPGPGFRFENTLLRVSGDQFCRAPKPLQTEAFGPVALLVLSRDTNQTIEILRLLEGNLTGTIYSHSGQDDDADYSKIEPSLRLRVGRLLNDRMPTGVAVSPAMNHGGPFPATGHPGFTAVGLPTSIQRFAALQCYDNVREGRLPALLRANH